MAARKGKNSKCDTGQVRRIPPFLWEQLCGISWEQGEVSWLQLSSRGVELRSTPVSWTTGFEAVRNNPVLWLPDSTLPFWHQLYSKMNSRKCCLIHILIAHDFAGKKQVLEWGFFKHSFPLFLSATFQRDTSLTFFPFKMHPQPLLASRPRHGC